MSITFKVKTSKGKKEVVILDREAMVEFPRIYSWDFRDL